jgi:hypothetical protein
MSLMSLLNSHFWRPVRLALEYFLQIRLRLKWTAEDIKNSENNTRKEKFETAAYIFVVY